MGKKTIPELNIGDVLEMPVLLPGFSHEQLIGTVVSMAETRATVQLSYFGIPMKRVIMSRCKDGWVF